MTPLFTLIARMAEAARTRALLRETLGPILARGDDHLLCDIGLTRQEALHLMQDAVMPEASLRMQAEAGMLCRSA